MSRRLKGPLLALALACTTLAGATAPDQQGDRLYQQALVKERAQGDLDGAITLYARIVREHASDRVLAANALMRMAGCYDLQGSPEARTIYQRIVKDFPEQQVLAAEARRRLFVPVATPPAP